MRVAGRRGMGGQLLGKLTPLPPFPFPLLLEQSADVLRRGHTHADPTRPSGVLVRAIGAASQTGLAVWMPWPSSPTPWHPPVPVTFYSILRSRFRWRLTIASVVFTGVVVGAVALGFHQRPARHLPGPPATRLPGCPRAPHGPRGKVRKVLKNTLKL